MSNVKTPFCLRLKGPCGSVRRCRDDTVTHDTSVQRKMSPPVTLDVTIARSSKNENRPELTPQKNDVSRSEETKNPWRVRTSDSSDRIHVSDIHNNFTRTKSVSMVSCYNLAISTSITNTKNISRQDLATVHALSSMLYGFASMARPSSVGLISQISVLNVSFNRQDVIVFVKQSDSIADVSIQRGSSPFDPSTSSSQSSRLSKMSCFIARQINRQTFVVDSFVIGRNQMCKETFTICTPDVSHCCRSRFSH